MTALRKAGPLARALWLVAGVALACFLLGDVWPDLVRLPDGWALPVASVLGGAMDSLALCLKPAARAVSAALELPMQGIRQLYSALPWPAVLALVTAAGWRAGGGRIALLALAGFGAVLVSGYWSEGMNTLALVTVSMPLAVLAGLALGIAAYEAPPLRKALLALFDAMQTIPTFAYLTPLLLLFGFGPVVGVIASAIYAAPPMARNVLLGLDRVDEDIREAAIMSGGKRWQQLFLVELPAARVQIMVGFNQCVMATLSMVIIAAVIGGFNDIGWEVLMTMRKAEFGQSLIAGMVIVVFAVVLDRVTQAVAREEPGGSTRVALAIMAIGAVLSVLPLADPSSLDAFGPVADALDGLLGRFTAAYGIALDTLKTKVVYFLLLPLRIGLDGAVLPFTWGFSWTPSLSWALLGAAMAMAVLLAWRGWLVGAALAVIAALVLETGIAELPWPVVMVAVLALGAASGGWRLGVGALLLMVFVLLSGLWAEALLSLYLAGVSVIICAIFGFSIGLGCTVWPSMWSVVRPVCDMLQTIPMFVFLIPFLMLFQVGEFSAFLAICAYAVVPMIRYTHHGLTHTPGELVEAALTSGATEGQMLREVRLPWAVPSLLLGLNQTILYAFAMLVIAALIGTTELGQKIYVALGTANAGMGLTAGLAMAILAFVADRILQGFATRSREALGL